MSMAMIRDLYEYHRWANRKLFDFAAAPARGASTGISIFMDSSTITGSPAATLSPTLAVTWKTTPVICALISSAMERSLFDHLSVHPAAAEIRVRGDRAEQRQRRLDALHHAGVHCPRQALD